MDDHDKRSDFDHIGHILDNVLKSYRAETDSGLRDIWHLWDAAVGEAIAQNARPAAFKGNLLIVHVSNSTWIHQLQFLKNDLISALNTALGQPFLTDIKFKIGSLK
jgi:predicted nucleic acid-binding Zn ribbon protein